MSNTSVHHAQTLEQANADEVRKIIPSIVAIGMLMVIGLIGNPLVIYFYSFVQRRKPSFMLIVVIACFDLLTSCISIPLELVDMIHFITFPSITACKCLRFVSHFAILGSGTTLLAVAVDRYRKVCAPFGRQLTMTSLRYVIIFIVIWALLNACPALVFYTVVNVNVTSEGNIIGHDCTTHRDEDFKRYIDAYNIYCFVMFLLIAIILLTLYSMVGFQLSRLKRRGSTRLSRFGRDSTTSMIRRSDRLSSFFKKRAKKPDPDSSSEQSSKMIGDDKGDNKGNINSNGDTKMLSAIDSVPCEQIELKYKPEVNEKESGTLIHNVSLKEHKGRPASKHTFLQDNHNQRIRTVKFTVITLCISVVYIGTFLPYLILSLWRTWAADYEPNLLSDSELAVFQFFIRSVLFSSACNPIINGLLNSPFKSFLTVKIKTLCCCCSK